MKGFYADLRSFKDDWIVYLSVSFRKVIRINFDLHMRLTKIGLITVLIRDEDSSVINLDALNSKLIPYTKWLLIVKEEYFC